MAPTAVFCRTQEAAQRARAAAATLANVRDLAVVAADAWAKEAILADRRQVRQDSKLSTGFTPGDEACLPNENPDRGWAATRGAPLMSLD